MVQHQAEETFFRKHRAGAPERFFEREAAGLRAQIGRAHV